MCVPVCGRNERNALWPIATLAILVLLLIPVHLCNKPLFLWLNSLHSPFSDRFWVTFTTIGDGLCLGIVVGAFVVKNPRVTALGLILIVISSIAVHMLKAAFPAPRPAEALGAIHVVGPLLRSSSFPSGHTASAISAALAVWYCYDSRAAGWLAIVVAVLIALSRIFVGAHFPQDVVGGAICALSCFVLVYLLYWPLLMHIIPDRPDLTRRWFRVLLRLELSVAAFVVVVWGPFAAESPTVGVIVGIAVLVFVTSAYLRLARAVSDSAPGS